MRGGFEFTAVVNVHERDIMPIFRNVMNTFKLTFNDYRSGFYGRKSLFAFKDKKHYRTFVLHCDLNGIAVYDSIDEAVNALLAQ